MCVTNIYKRFFTSIFTKLGKVTLLCSHFHKQFVCGLLVRVKGEFCLELNLNVRLFTAAAVSHI